MKSGIHTRKYLSSADTITALATCSLPAYKVYKQDHHLADVLFSLKDHELTIFKRYNTIYLLKKTMHWYVPKLMGDNLHLKSHSVMSSVKF